MQFIVAASLFAAALAAPAPQTGGTARETITITDFSLRKNNGTINSVNFKLTGDEAKEPILCSIPETTTLPSKLITCDDSKSNYRVALIEPKEANADADLAIYHQTGSVSGIWNESPLPPNYCHAGGNGPDDFICAQVGDAFTVVLSPGGPFDGTN